MTDDKITAKVQPQSVTLTEPSREGKIGRAIGTIPPMVFLSFAWLVLMIVVALLGDLIAPYDYQGIDLMARLSPPVWMEGGSTAHLLGTDDLGRDVLSRLIFSIRVSLFVALLGTLIGAVVGTVIGFIAAHFRGWIDDLVMAAIDFQAALPFMILALAIVASLEMRPLAVENLPETTSPTL